MLDFKRYLKWAAVVCILLNLIVNISSAEVRGKPVAYIVCSNGEIIKIDIETLQEVKKKAPGFDLWTHSIQISKDGRWLYGIGSYAMLLAKVDLENWELVKSISPGDKDNPLYGKSTHSFLLTPDGQKIFVAQAWNKTAVIATDTLEVVDVIGKGIGFGIWTKKAVFSPDGRLLYSYFKGNIIDVTEVATNSLKIGIEVPQNFGNHLRDLTLSEDGTELYLLVAFLEKPEEYLLAYDIGQASFRVVAETVATHFVGPPIEGKVYLYEARREFSPSKERVYYRFVPTQKIAVIDIDTGTTVKRISFPDLIETVGIEKEKVVGVTRDGFVKVRDSSGIEYFVGYGLVRMSPDGKKLFFALSTGSVEAGLLVIQDMDTGLILKKIPVGASIAGIAFGFEPQ